MSRVPKVDRATDALVLVDKPAGLTSFQVVREVGRAVGTKRAGHLGTLDPFATGLLVILTGRATRLARFVDGEPKVYLARIVFGEERDTDDATGDVTRTAPLPDLSALPAAIESLSGRLAQVPPAFSAKKVAGRRAYALARRGAAPQLDPAAVNVLRWEVLETGEDHLEARIWCSGGTYIRALARDLGRTLGSAAHLATLRREAIGRFRVEAADDWDQVRRREVTKRPVREALDLPQLALSPNDLQHIVHGRAVPAELGDGDRVAMIDDAGVLIAIARREAESWRPEVVLADG